MKKIFTIPILSAFLLFFGSTIALGSCTYCSNTMNSQQAEKKAEIIIMGQKVHCDVEPEMSYLSVQIPARHTLEHLGFQTFWDLSSMIATFTNSNNCIIQIIPGDNYAIINDTKHSLPSFAVIKNSRMLVAPELFEVIGYWVKWNPQDLILNINEYEWIES